MNKDSYSTVMSPARFIAELKELNPNIDLEMVDWISIKVHNMPMEEVILPKDFSVKEKDSQRLKLTNAQEATFGQYQPVLIFQTLENEKEDDLP